MSWSASILILLFAVCNVKCQLQSTFIKPLVNDTRGIATGGPLVQQLSRTLSEISGIFWSDVGAKVAYVDRYGPAFGRYTPIDGRFNRMAINEGKEATAVFPVHNATGLRFVIGLDNRLIMAYVNGSGTDLHVYITDLIVVSNKPEIFNKGKCDKNGRLWYATGSAHQRPTGNLYKIENLGTPQLMQKGLVCGAGMAWTPDDNYFYLVDECVGVIYKYDFNLEEGTIANRRVVFSIDNHRNITGRPFDIALDTDGYLWIGLRNGGAVIQYDENTKKILWLVAIPASDIVSVEFGDLDKKTLYVGTSTVHLKWKNSQPAAGAMFAVSGTGATGIPDNEIVIPAEYTY